MLAQYSGRVSPFHANTRTPALEKLGQTRSAPLRPRNRIGFASLLGEAFSGKPAVM